MPGRFYQRQAPGQSMDAIFITDLRIETRIGAYDWEQHVRQPVLINIEIAMPHARAAASDDLADALDYASVVGRIKALLADHPHHLLERLAEAIATLIREEFHAPWVQVQLAKITPLPGVRQLGVRIERGTRPA